ncbi:MAG TPA: helix-turn-helix transcriptional regulator [Polyangiaceae bacterium]
MAAAPYGLAFTWAGLCSGRLRIVRYVQDSYQTSLYLEERRADDALRWAIRERPLSILERVLAGQSLNYISLDLSLSCSTISAEFKVAMRALGLQARLSGLPLFLPQLWHAARIHANDPPRVRPGWDGKGATKVSLPRPDLILPTFLSPAELQVCAMLLQGSTHAEIANERGTSLRTTANQIASIFGKLKVSGRLELVTSLAQGRVHWSSTLVGPKRASAPLLD